MSKLQDFCTSVDTFLSEHGLAGRTLGDRALNDGGFVTRLRAGRRPRIDTIEIVEAWMADYAAGESRARSGAHRKVA